MKKLSLKGSSSRLTILTILILFISSSQSSPVKRETEEESPAQNSATAFLLTSVMDESANPCEDYYKYSCGKWGEMNAPPPGQPSYSYWELVAENVAPKLKNILERPDAPTDNEAIRKARKVYQKCSDSDAIEGGSMEPIKSVLDANGGWPLLTSPEEWNAKNLTWQQVHLNFWKAWITRSMFEVTVEPDVKNATINRITLTQPSMDVSRDELLNTEEGSEFMDAYKTYILEVVHLVQGSDDDEDTLTSDINEMIDFQTELVKISTDFSNIDNIDDFYNLISFDELQTLYDTGAGSSPTSQINWLETIRDMFSINPKVTIDESEKVLLKDKDYISKLGELLTRTPPRTIVNYIVWTSIAAIAEHGNGLLTNSLVTFNGKREGAEDIPERDCTGKSQMKRAVSYAYVKENFPPEAKQKAEEMLKNLLEAMKQRIEKADWMDDDTRKAAVGKMEAIRTYTGYPNDFTDEDIDKYYEDFIPADTYFENEIRKRKFDKQKELEALGGPGNPNEWPEEPTTTNAFYKPTANAIYIPAGILQIPFYSPDRPSMINYAMVGAIIGHEIGHALDSTGRRFDKDGSVLVWWQQSSIDKYEEKSQCFVEQFSNYIVIDNDGEEPLHVDGNKTLEENTSDTTGLQIAFEAFKMDSDYNNETKIPGLERFTEEQIFFLAFSNVYCTVDTKNHLRNAAPKDEHSPGPARIIGAVSNMNEFAKAFNCPANSPVNPTNKCSLF